jgi:hypothetical protein
VISGIANSYETIDYWWAFVIRAVVVIAFAILFSRLLRPASTKDKLVYSILWTAILIVIHLFLIIPNGFHAILGHWGAYLVFVGSFAGPLVAKNVPPAAVVV